MPFFLATVFRKDNSITPLQQRERVRSRAYDHQKKVWADKLPHATCLQKAREFSQKILEIWDRDEGACFSVDGANVMDVE